MHRNKNKKTVGFSSSSKIPRSFLFIHRLFKFREPDFRVPDNLVAVVALFDGFQLLGKIGDVLLLPKIVSENMIRFIAKVALYFSGILVLLIALGIYSANKFIQPIHRLQEAFAAMARGNLTEREERTSSDEIGELSDSFNSLAQQFGSLTAGILGVKDDLSHSGKRLSEDVSSTTAAVVERIGAAEKSLSEISSKVSDNTESIDRQLSVFKV